MEVYLIVDIDDLQNRLKAQNLALDLHEVSTSMRNGATLAAGLRGADELKAIAVADWNRIRSQPGRIRTSIEQIFKTAGYEIFNSPERAFLVDALMIHYFSRDVVLDELVIVTTQQDIAGLSQRVTLKPGARVRIWGDEETPIEGTIFQPLTTVLGIPTKTVSLFIDFENITIGLNEQGYIIELDHLIEAMMRQARAHGQVMSMAAYAPWGQRGSLPPLVDAQGREISDDAPSRLALANIDPVFNLPGKNSADMRIAKDLLADSLADSGAEIFIVASGDRDFNDVYGALRARGKQVIVWGIHGSTSRLLENNPAVLLEYIDDFAHFQRHTELEHIYSEATTDQHGAPLAFRPSQWSSVVLQFDRLAAERSSSPIRLDDLTDQLVEVHTVTSSARGEELLSQAEGLALISINANGIVRINEEHPIARTTRLISDRIVSRVANTLSVRSWDYVNYGFLLKGISMDLELSGSGLNIDDNWRSEWVDALVREGILARELVAHRHNPEDLVPVILLPENFPMTFSDNQDDSMDDESFTPPMVFSYSNATAVVEMLRRVIVSIEQFTSFRGFAWCPLGSLHKRLRAYDNGTYFQQAVEILQERGAVNIGEYQNPQSSFRTKGISLVHESDLVKEVLAERDFMVRTLLKLYQEYIPITQQSIKEATQYTDKHLDLWISIMQVENVLNLVPGHDDLFSLFRTHHTVGIIAEKHGIEN